MRAYRHVEERDGTCDMSTVRASIKADNREWTVADLQRRFGPIPFSAFARTRARHGHREGRCSGSNDHEDRLFELVDGVLVEKTAGFVESWLAARLACLIGLCIEPRNLGIVTGADGMYRLASGLIRIPDVAFISWDRIPRGEIPEEPLPDLVPDLVIEVISRSNTAGRWTRSSAIISRKAFAWSGWFVPEPGLSTSTPRQISSRG